MGKRDYPLKAARELREHAVDESSRALAAAVAASRTARAAVEEAVATLQVHESATRAWEAAEAERGAGSAATFQQVQLYRERRAGERAALAAGVEAARAELEARRAAETRAREALAETRAEAEAVVRHESQWRDARKREAEMKDELEAEDVAQARRFHDES